MTFFANNCIGGDENIEGRFSFSAPTGSPSLTAETPLSGDGLPFMIADLPIQSGVTTYGPYNSNGCVGVNFAYNLLIPE